MFRRVRNFLFGKRRAKKISENGPYKVEYEPGPKGLQPELSWPKYSKKDVLRRAKAVRKNSKQQKN